MRVVSCWASLVLVAWSVQCVSGLKRGFPVFLEPRDGAVVYTGPEHVFGSALNVTVRVLVAHWEPEKYVIAFDVNDARIREEHMSKRVNTFSFSAVPGEFYVLTAKLLMVSGTTRVRFAADE